MINTENPNSHHTTEDNLFEDIHGLIAVDQKKLLVTDFKERNYTLVEEFGSLSYAVSEYAFMIQAYAKVCKKLSEEYILSVGAKHEIKRLCYLILDDSKELSKHTHDSEYNNAALTIKSQSDEKYTNESIKAYSDRIETTQRNRKILLKELIRIASNLRIENRLEEDLDNLKNNNESIDNECEVICEGLKGVLKKLKKLHTVSADNICKSLLFCIKFQYEEYTTVKWLKYPPEMTLINEKMKDFIIKCQETMSLFNIPTTILSEEFDNNKKNTMNKYLSDLDKKASTISNEISALFKEIQDSIERYETLIKEKPFSNRIIEDNLPIMIENKFISLSFIDKLPILQEVTKALNIIYNSYKPKKDDYSIFYKYNYEQYINFIGKHMLFFEQLKNQSSNKTEFKPTKELRKFWIVCSNQTQKEVSILDHPLNIGYAFKNLIKSALFSDTKKNKNEKPILEEEFRTLQIFNQEYLPLYDDLCKEYGTSYSHIS